ncbi:hypothetical protein D9611_008855 [Ephemerocybe angulata]|uniref:Uncharacterized protein n=1 Tax=Ephemerocybe angulata TaxID=980116 RepID=A0A8H5BYE6_9AGAR|nr:hypothetical protein D9611_008855 [Tulosesus angulatus]
MQRSLFLLLTFFTYAFAAVVAYPPTPTGLYTGRNVPRTNAQRFARGLPPLAPKRLYSEASRVRREPLPSGVPTVSGSLAVRNQDGTSTLGYLTQSADGSWKAADTSSVVVTFRNPVVYPGSRVELNIGSLHLNLGAWVGGSGAAPHIGLEDTSKKVDFALSALTTPQDTPPIKDVDRSNVARKWWAESTIFWVDDATGVIRATWRNENWSTYDLDFMMGPDNVVFAVPDAALYLTTTGLSDVTPVTLVVVPAQAQPQWEK